MSKYQEYLKIFELPEEATLEEIKIAYRKLIKIWHPDQYENEKDLQKSADKKAKEINEAYSYLIENYTDEDEDKNGNEAEEEFYDFSQQESTQQNYSTDFDIEEDYNVYSKCQFKHFQIPYMMKLLIYFVISMFLTFGFMLIIVKLS